MRSDRGKSKTKLIIPIFIIGIMILSVFGVMIGGLTSDDSTIKHKGFVFRNTNGGYSFQSGGNNYLIQNDPRNVEGFYSEYPLNFLSDLSNAKYNKIYVDVSDDKAITASGIVYNNLKGKLSLDLSCMPENEDDSRCANLPIKECGIDNNYIVVSFNVAEEKASVYEENCLKISGSEGYLSGMADVLIMAHAGVFNEQ